MPSSIISLVSANIGGIDLERAMPQQTREHHYHYFTRPPYPLPNLNNRLKGKYCKILTHRILGSDIFIWIDGSVQILTEDFVEWCCEQVKDCDVAISRHPDRTNVFDEIDYILRNTDTSTYLSQRYSEEPFVQERAFYEKKGLPRDFPLYACWFFVRKNNNKLNNVFDDWWMRVLEFTNFDQTQFSYCAWKHRLEIKEVTTERLLRHPH